VRDDRYYDPRDKAKERQLPYEFDYTKDEKEEMEKAKSLVPYPEDEDRVGTFNSFNPRLEQMKNFCTNFLQNCVEWMKKYLKKSC
jgi:hypothetical protein